MSFPVDPSGSHYSSLPYSRFVRFSKVYSILLLALPLSDLRERSGNKCWKERSHSSKLLSLMDAALLVKWCFELCNVVRILFGAQLEGTIRLSFRLAGKKVAEEFFLCQNQIFLATRCSCWLSKWCVTFPNYMQQTLKYLVKYNWELQWLCCTPVDGNDRITYFQWKDSLAAQKYFRL